MKLNKDNLVSDSNTWEIQFSMFIYILGNNLIKETSVQYNHIFAGPQKYNNCAACCSHVLYCISVLPVAVCIVALYVQLGAVVLILVSSMRSHDKVSANY